MLETELIALVERVLNEQCERQDLEVKKAKDGIPNKLYDTLSSFANQHGGGTILFGLDEANRFDVTGVYDGQDLQKKVMEQSLQMEPQVRPLMTVVKYNGLTVVSAEIGECDVFHKPCFYKGAGRLRGSYIRLGDSDQRMSEYEIYSYEVFKRRIHDELRVIDGASDASLPEDKKTGYLLELMRKKPNLKHMEEKRLLQTQGIYKGGPPTVCGLMLLGEYPQEFFPQLSIIATMVPGQALGVPGSEGERFIDNQRIEGTLFEMLETAMAFVDRNMKIKTIIGEDGKRVDISEYPMIAVREILLNALVHRDYSIHTEGTPIRLTMFSDRMELENPGGLYGRMTIDDLGNVAADIRNPYIAGAMEVQGETENRFSGIPTVRMKLREAGMGEPIFESKRGMFKVTFYKKNAASVTEMRMDTSDIEQRILEFCRTPRSREALAREFKFDTPSYMIKRYIMPLIEKDVLKMTIPEKPKSKFQRYIRR